MFQAARERRCHVQRPGIKPGWLNLEQARIRNLPLDQNAPQCIASPSALSRTTKPTRPFKRTASFSTCAMYCNKKRLEVSRSFVALANSYDVIKSSSKIANVWLGILLKMWKSFSAIIEKLDPMDLKVIKDDVDNICQLWRQQKRCFT